MTAASRPCLLATCLCLGLLAGKAQAGESNISLIERALDRRLHESVVWQRLLHYHPTAGGVVLSHVDDPRFFLAADGKHDPLAELQASITALIGPTADGSTDGDRSTGDQSSDQSSRCRFVAREQWLRQQLALPAVDVPASCREYHQWRDRLATASVTLVFPAAFLNNPSSMFGHTLLRFDAAGVADDSEWLSWSLNFAAEVGDDHAGTLGYAVRGIAGGYPGTFSVLPYFQKIQTYGAIENRDIWEYRLDLTIAEIDRLMRHVWELRDIRFDYFFFRQNCSFRLLELLEYARPGLQLTSQFPLTAIPAATVKAIDQAGLVSAVAYRPSVGTTLAHRLSTLDRGQRRWVERIVADPAVVDETPLRALSVTARQQLVSIANQLLTYRSRQASIGDDMTSRRFRMLQTLARLPASEAVVIPTPARPDQAHDTRRLSLGVGRRFGSDFTEAGFRISYHDLLDRLAGYPRGAGITLGHLTLRHYGHRADDTVAAGPENGGPVADSLRVEAFELVSLASLALEDRALGTLAWTVDAGLRRVPWLRDDRLGAHLKGSVGQSLSLSPNIGGYALLGASGAAYTGGRGKRWFVNAHARAGVLGANRLGAVDAHIALDSWQTRSLVSSVAFAQNIVLGRHDAVRLSLTRSHFDGEGDNRAQLSWLRYF